LAFHQNDVPPLPQPPHTGMTSGTEAEQHHCDPVPSLSTLEARDGTRHHGTCGEQPHEGPPFAETEHCKGPERGVRQEVMSWWRCNTRPWRPAPAALVKDTVMPQINNAHPHPRGRAKRAGEGVAHRSHRHTHQGTSVPCRCISPHSLDKWCPPLRCCLN